MADSGAHHGIDYIEIPVLDMEAAKAFYGAAFGWRFNAYGPDYTGIVDGARGEREAGGLRRVDEVVTGGPLVILYSDDLEASEAAVREAGGEIVAPIFAFPGGRRFELLDPSGHRLGVWGA
ncbi:MAG: VOC family protein [Sandaracinaceae bacterium]|nr:MAG: VOC family protein [Sandaracinaceae bacterium]